MSEPIKCALLQELNPCNSQSRHLASNRGPVQVATWNTDKQHKVCLNHCRYECFISRIENWSHEFSFRPFLIRFCLLSSAHKCNDHDNQTFFVWLRISNRVSQSKEYGQENKWRRGSIALFSAKRVSRRIKFSKWLRNCSNNEQHGCIRLVSGSKHFESFD